MRLRLIAAHGLLVLASCSGERRAPDVPAPPESAPLVPTSVTNPSNAPAPPPRAMQSRTIGYDGQVGGGAAHVGAEGASRDTTAPQAGAREGRFWAPTTPATGNMNPSPPDAPRQGRWAPTTPATGNMNPSPPGP